MMYRIFAVLFTLVSLMGALPTSAQETEETLSGLIYAESHNADGQIIWRGVGYDLALPPNATTTLIIAESPFFIVENDVPTKLIESAIEFCIEGDGLWENESVIQTTRLVSSTFASQYPPATDEPLASSRFYQFLLNNDMTSADDAGLVDCKPNEVDEQDENAVKAAEEALRVNPVNAVINTYYDGNLIARTEGSYIQVGSLEFTLWINFPSNSQFVAINDGDENGVYDLYYNSGTAIGSGGLERCTAIPAYTIVADFKHATSSPTLFNTIYNNDAPGFPTDSSCPQGDLLGWKDTVFQKYGYASTWIYNVSAESY